jgi:hypothetical protein
LLADILLKDLCSSYCVNLTLSLQERQYWTAIRPSMNDNQDEDKVMNISSINSSSSAMMSGAMKRPDPSKMAEDLFSKLDTKGQGYIEKSDLESALNKASQSDSSSSSSSSNVADALFSRLDNNGDGKVTKEEMSATIQKIAAELDGPSPRMRMQGGTPPPPPPQGGDQKAGSTDSSSTSTQTSDPADTNGDGMVSASESLAYEISQAASSTGDSSANTSSSASSTDAQLMQILADKMQPHQGGQGDQGFTKDQLNSMSKELGSTDSKRSKVMSDIASNFDAADTNGDGKVNGTEARAFEESKNASGTGSNTDASSSASSADARFMKQMMQLLHAYSDPNQTAESSSFSTSV